MMMETKTDAQKEQKKKTVIGKKVEKVKKVPLVKRWWSKTPKFWLGLFRVTGVIGVGASVVLLGASTFGLALPAVVATYIGWTAIGSSAISAMSKAVDDDDAIANPIEFAKNFLGKKKPNN